MLDIQDLQNQVIDHWENEAVPYFEHDTQSGPNIPAGGFTETTIKPEYQDILDDPILCIEELGYNSVSEYIQAQGVQSQPMQGVEMGYSRISKLSTKYFFQFAGRELEFYIERDPQTGLAKLWLNPGVTDGLQAFLGALTLELMRSEGK